MRPMAITIETLLNLVRSGEKTTAKHNFEFRQIGVIHSPYKKPKDGPIQASRSSAVGEIEVFEEYEEGLKDVEGFSYILIVYLFHRSRRASLLVKPFLDDELRGVFATRSPNRPNRIGLSCVELLERRGNVLRVKGIDVVEGTPLLDIKPYVPQFDIRESVRIGWLEGRLR
jgi:tRNA-Thr(GGU) m(6)t(6)A37 methyltransferase TsaA